jgi:hypothetical protein
MSTVFLYTPSARHMQAEKRTDEFPARRTAAKTE